MKEKDIITAAMKSCGWTQKELANRAGYNTQSAISNRLGGKSIRVDTFVKLLSVMGYEVIVRSTSPNINKNKWIVGEETTVNEPNKPQTAHRIDLDTMIETKESTEDTPTNGLFAKDGKIKLV